MVARRRRVEAPQGEHPNHKPSQCTPQITEGKLTWSGITAWSVLIRCSLNLIKLGKTCRRRTHDYHDWVVGTSYPLAFPT